MKWVVAADFFEGHRDVWLDDFIDDPALRFEKVAPSRKGRGWHHRASARTTVSGWADHMRHAFAVMRGRPAGVITLFPPLALCAGLLKALRIARPRIVAYNFNLGALPGGPRRRLARAAAPQIDRFIVHSPSEIAAYADYLDLPRTRFRFVPVQKGDPGIARNEDVDAPFLLAMGSAHRDYATLIAALEPLGLPTVIVARRDIADALPSHAWLTVRHGLTEEECLALLSRARLSVTPIDNPDTASGQVTFVNAMRLGVPVIATDCPGTEGYIEDGRTGRLVPPRDAVFLRSTIEELWHDADTRERLSAAARIEAEARFSDQAVSEMLRSILLELQENDA